MCQGLSPVTSNLVTVKQTEVGWHSQAPLELALTVHGRRQDLAAWSASGGVYQLLTEALGGDPETSMPFIAPGPILLDL